MALTVYFAGDTDLFGDMRLIGELYRPAIAFLPIGDRFTMGPAQAAKACELLGVRQVVPMHYGTFPALTGTPARCGRSSSRGASGAGARTRRDHDLRERIAKTVVVQAFRPARRGGPLRSARRFAIAI